MTYFSGKGSPKIWAALVILKTAKSKHTPKGQKFAQFGHPG
jgi:hypothetical protein